MAIQVRLDLTPQEFDLIRAALDHYKEDRLAVVGDEIYNAPVRAHARAEAVRLADLLAKVR